MAARYSARINGLDTLALTKLDVLDGIDPIQICTGYRTGDRVITEFPADLQLLADCEPVYEAVPGWQGETRGVRRYEDLPEGARSYIRRLEEVSGVPIGIVSTGSDREETIIRDESILGRPASVR